MFISLFAVTLVSGSTVVRLRSWKDACECRMGNPRYTPHAHSPLEVETFLLLPLVFVVVSSPLPCQCYFLQQVFGQIDLTSPQTEDDKFKKDTKPRIYKDKLLKLQGVSKR